MGHYGKPDSESAIFILLYSSCLHTKLCQDLEVRNDAKPSACMDSRMMTLLVSKELASNGNVRPVVFSCLRVIETAWLVPSLSNDVDI